MSKIRIVCIILMVLLAAVYQSEESVLKIKSPHQPIVKEHSPVNIIHIKPAEISFSKNYGQFQRKQKSTGLSESTAPSSSVIVIKPVLTPVAGHPAKRSSKKFWKKMMRRPKFLHNIKSMDAGVVTRVARVHLAPGAYPVFYGLAKTNGNFDKIKSISHAPAK